MANLCAMSKVIEKIVAMKLSAYMEKYKLISDFQSAFRKHRNCTTSVLQLQDKILKDAAKGLDNSSVFTDISAAFDTIDHEVLIDKLKLYGLDGGAIRWFKNYFSDKAQYCEIGAARSTIIKIVHGVFQGSILGPLVFIIFMNDCTIIGNKNILFIIYADDTTMSIKLSGNYQNDQELVNMKMNKISEFMNSNQLAFNFKKTNLQEYFLRTK